MRLLRLSTVIKDKIAMNNLTERHARALLRISGESEREKLLEAIIKNNLNVQATDQLINRYLESIQGSKPKKG